MTRANYTAIHILTHTLLTTPWSIRKVQLLFCNKFGKRRPILIILYHPRIEGGIVFSCVCLCVCLFLCLRRSTLSSTTGKQASTWS